MLKANENRSGGAQFPLLDCAAAGNASAKAKATLSAVSTVFMVFLQSALPPFSGGSGTLPDDPGATRVVTPG